MSATTIVQSALAGTGIDLVASCAAEAYDARSGRRAADWVAGARGVIVAGSAGPDLWRAFRARTAANPELWRAAHPYDAFVGELLDRADAALTAAGIRFHRFDAAFHAPVRVDFLALANLVGLGSPGPFRLLIHPRYGAWWALRGAWIVDAEVDAALPLVAPCAGCPAPCVGGKVDPAEPAWPTPAVRSRCVLGQDARYDDDQIAYHYDREATAARLAAHDRTGQTR
jgi:hypothetical protein